MKIASFDVFDTVVTRCVARPTDLFAFIPARAGVVCPDFRQRRMAAEQASYAPHGGHTTLEIIYRDEEGLLGLSVEELTRCKAAEIELELEACHPIPITVEKIKVARAEGSQIAFLSDMYLPGSVIREILQRAGAYEAGDLLLVSCEQRAGKGDGKLFEVLMRETGASIGQIVHTGNDRHSDVEVPRRLGIEARHFVEGNLTPRELSLAGLDPRPEAWCGLLAATSRRVRLEKVEASEHLRAVRDITASVASPILAAYVLWVLRVAQEDGVKVLYFAARDGYQMMPMAHALAKGLGCNIEIRYLYGSRQAWHLPSVTQIDERTLSWLFDFTENLTLGRVLARVCLEVADVQDELSEYGIIPELSSRILKPVDMERLASAIRKSSKIQREILKKAEEKRRDLYAYLMAENLGSRKKSAIVDLGWSGRGNRSLNFVLKMNGIPEVCRYYLGLIQKQTGSDIARSYMYHPEDSPLAGAVICLIESFFTAPHGSTMGYEASKDSVVPILDSRPNGLGEWGIDTASDANATFAQMLFSCQSFWPTSEDIPSDILKKHLMAFLKAPSVREASEWGLFPFDNEQVNGVSYRLAEPFAVNVRNLWIVLTTGSAPIKHSNAWVAGCHRLTPRWYSLILKALAGLRKII